MKEDKIEKIKSEEEGLEMNEELKEIDEILEKYKDVEIIRGIKDIKEEDYVLVYEKFPRVITNNELPEPFYSFEKREEEEGGLLSKLFSRLELMEVDDYNKKMAGFLKRRPDLRFFGGLYPYQSNYDGKNIFKGEVFSDYSIKEKGETMEANKDLVKFGQTIIYTIQKDRLAFSEKNFSLFVAEAYADIRYVAYGKDAKKHLSEELLKKALDVYGEFTKARCEDIEPSSWEEIKKESKKRFPTKKAWHDELVKLNDMTLEFSKEAITEIKQKMKENYEAKKESK